MKKAFNLLVLLVGLICYSSAALVNQDNVINRKQQFYLSHDSAHKLRLKFNTGLRQSKHGYWKLSVNPQLANILNRYGGRLKPLITLSEERINNIEEKVHYFQKQYIQSRKSTYTSYDLKSYMQVDVLNPTNEKLFALAVELEKLDIIDYVELVPENMPPPNKISVKLPIKSNNLNVPDYEELQNYLGPDPGINIHYAWSRGITGKGVSLVDLEYNWNFQHEGFHDSSVGYGGNLSPLLSFFQDHGTAVAGMICARNNSVGITGGMFDIEKFIGIPELSHEHGHNRPLAFSKALEVLSPGDVIIVEMQTVGPGDEAHYVLAEYEQSVWDMTRMATDMGIIVIAAGGNGNQNMDDSKFAAYRNRGDSGAIIVGAGSSDVAHQKLWYSTYGSQFHLQAWGENIVTAGYGDLAGEEINNHYSASFGGTSGAASMVALVVIAVLSHAEINYGIILSPAETREILALTATSCVDCALIGKIPDTKAALLEVDKRYGAKINKSPVGACINYCGEQAQSGCWCDQWCDNYGDCCSDYDVSCITRTDSESCVGNCNNFTGNCWCDPLCKDYGDCCADVQLYCSPV